MCHGVITEGQKGLAGAGDSVPGGGTDGKARRGLCVAWLGSSHGRVTRKRCRTCVVNVTMTWPKLLVGYSGDGRGGGGGAWSTNRMKTAGSAPLSLASDPASRHSLCACVALRVSGRPGETVLCQCPARTRTSRTLSLSCPCPCSSVRSRSRLEPFISLLFTHSL